MAYAGLSLEGQSALITGSARGIGRALAIGLAEAGAEVAVSDAPERLDEARTVQTEIERLGNKSGTYSIDVLNLENVRSSIDQVASDFGGLDILVNNAGIRIHRPALEITAEEWDAVVDTNLKGVFFCAQAAARHMVERGYGRIINISSDLAVVARRNRAAYCASKAGVANLTRALALEWIDYGVTVNAAGTIDTQMVQGQLLITPNMREQFLQQIPLRRFSGPLEVASVADFLDTVDANDGWVME